MVAKKYLTPIDCMKWPEKALTVAGLWEYKSDNNGKQMLYKMYSKFIYFQFALATFVQVMALIFGDTSLKGRAATASSLVCTINIVLKLVIIRMNILKINDLLQQTNEEPFKPRNEEEERLLKEASKRANVLGGAFAISVAVTVSSFALGAVILKQNILKFWYPFDDTKTPQVHYANGHQVSFGIFGGTSLVVLDWLLFWIFSFISYQYKLIGLRLSNCGFDGENKFIITERYCGEIVDNVKLHIKTEEFITNFKKTFNLVLFLQVTQSAFVFSLKMLLILLTNNSPAELLTHLTYQLAVLIQMGVYCYLGSEIMDAAEKLPNKAYFSNFVRFGKRSSIALLLLMHVSMTRTTSITAEGVFVFEFSLPTFLGILKQTYSILAVFRSLM